MSATYRALQDAELEVKLDEFKAKFISLHNRLDIANDFDTCWEIGIVIPGSFMIKDGKFYVMKSVIMAHSRNKNEWHVFFDSPVECTCGQYNGPETIQQMLKFIELNRWDDYRRLLLLKTYSCNC
jgi:hypothetical protein